MERPVHYASVGIAGFAFPCFSVELRAHVESKYEAPSKAGKFMVSKYRVPTPRSHTNIQKVTCRECWEGIARMAKERL